MELLFLSSNAINKKYCYYFLPVAVLNYSVNFSLNFQ